MTAAIVIVAVLALLALTFVLIRNSIVASRNRVDESWSATEAQLKRRHDLVPSLVEAVKGYASHECAVFEKLSTARTQAMSARTVGEAGQKEGQLTVALAELRAVAERHPQLLATENFQQLSRNLTGIEVQIQVARITYNSDVQTYNTMMQVFPSSIVARVCGFAEREFFEIDRRQREAPRVSL